MNTVEDWNPHEGDDGDSQSSDSKGKRIIADPDWTPSESNGGEPSESNGGEPSESDGDESSESDGGEDQQQLRAVENGSSVLGEELLPGEGTITTESDFYDQFHVEPAPQRSYNPRYHSTFFCRLSPCIQKKLFLKTYDAWKVHRTNVHQVSGDYKKKLPTLGEIHDWVNSGKIQPWRRPERPLPIPQPIQPSPAPGWTPPQGCRPATNESNIFEQFDAVELEDAGDNKSTPLNYFCLLGPCFEKGIPGKGMQDLKIHRRAVHQIHSHSDNKREQLPHGWDVRDWVNMGKPRPYVPKPKKPRKRKVRSSDAGNTEETAPNNAMVSVLESTEMKPKRRSKRATKVESDESAQRITKSAPTTLPRVKRISSVETMHANPDTFTENVDPDPAGMETATENVNLFATAGVANVDPNAAAAAYEDDSEDVDPDVVNLEDPDEEDSESPDLLGEENFWNVTEFSLNHEPYELAASASMEYPLMKSSHPRPEQMESSLHHLEPMGSSHHLLQPEESSLNHLKPMVSSHHLLKPMESSYHYPDYNDNNVNKYLCIPSDDDPTGIGENKTPLCTGANYKSKIVFGHTFGPPIPKEQRMIPLKVLNPLFDIPKENSIHKNPPILEEKNHKRTPLGPLNPIYLQGTCPQQLTTRATMMAITGAQQQHSAIAGEDTTKRNAYCEFDVMEQDGKLKFSCLLPDCLGNGTHPTTQTELHCHQRDYHPDLSPSLPKSSSIEKWLSLGKPRPFIQKAVCPHKRSHSKVAVPVDLKPQELPKGPLDQKTEPLLPKSCSLESLQGVVATSSLLIDTSMVAQTSPDSLEGPMISPTSLGTLGGEVVAATGPTSFKGPVLSATSLDALEDHVVVATTPSSFEVTNPASFDVRKVDSPSPDSIGDSATQTSLESRQVEAFDLGQGVDGNHEKETDTSHMMAQELSNGQVDSYQAAPNASVPDALALFLEDLDHEENKLCMYTPSSGEQENDEHSIFSEQAMKEFDRALFDF